MRSKGRCLVWGLGIFFTVETVAFIWFFANIGGRVG